LRKSITVPERRGKTFIFPRSFFLRVGACVLESLAMRSRALSIFNAAALLKAGGGSAVGPSRAMSASPSTNAASSSPSSSAASTSASTNSGSAAGDAGDSALHRPLRLLLLATLAGAAAAVLPQTLAPCPQAAVALLRADGARLRAAGAGRAARIGGGGEPGARSLAAVPGAAVALLDAAFRAGRGGDAEEEEAAAAALKAAVAWAAHPEGAAALKEAGAEARAAEAVAATKEDNGGGSQFSAEATEDARHLCWLLGHRK